MTFNRLITFAALAALGFASAATAQQRERRSDRDRAGDDRGAQEQSSAPLSTTRPAGYLDRYAILERNNIFVRDRSRPTSRPAQSASTQPARLSLEQSLVVRGIAMEDLGYRAYVEDLNKGTTLRLSPGDPLGRGEVVAIALDAIQFEQDGRRRWIDIGSDLTGRQSSALAASSAPAAGDSPTTLPANIDLNDPSLSVEQRMRLRRQLQNQRGR